MFFYSTHSDNTNIWFCVDHHTHLYKFAGCLLFDYFYHSHSPLGEFRAEKRKLKSEDSNNEVEKEAKKKRVTKHDNQTWNFTHIQHICNCYRIWVRARNPRWTNAKSMSWQFSNAFQSFGTKKKNKRNEKKFNRKSQTWHIPILYGWSNNVWIFLFLFFFWKWQLVETWHKIQILKHFCYFVSDWKRKKKKRKTDWENASIVYVHKIEERTKPNVRTKIKCARTEYPLMTDKKKYIYFLLQKYNDFVFMAKYQKAQKKCLNRIFFFFFFRIVCERDIWYKV